jgi:hypothetical protein
MPVAGRERRAYNHHMEDARLGDFALLPPMSTV